MEFSTKKTVLITGCSEGGVGAALAVEYQRQGYRVFATARNIASMESLSALGIETLTLDVTVSQHIQDIKERISELTGGKLDILVNNAGMTYPFSVADLSMERVREVYNVNVFGAMEMTHEFIPLLLASNDACIINVGSLAALTPLPFNAAYNSSKAALLSFGDTLRVELAPFNVKVITTFAGLLQTNIMKPYKTVTLPDSSIYQAVKSEYQHLRIEKFQDGAVPPAVFAQALVAQSMESRPKPWLWFGPNSWKVWLINTFLPRQAFDKTLSDMYGLSKLARMISGGEVKKAL